MGGGPTSPGLYKIPGEQQKGEAASPIIHRMGHEGGSGCRPTPSSFPQAVIPATQTVPFACKRIQGRPEGRHRGRAGGGGQSRVTGRVSVSFCPDFHKHNLSVARKQRLGQSPSMVQCGPEREVGRVRFPDGAVLVPGLPPVSSFPISAPKRTFDV